MVLYQNTKGSCCNISDFVINKWYEESSFVWGQDVICDIAIVPVKNQTDLFYL